MELPRLDPKVLASLPAEQQVEARKILEELEALWRSNPLQRFAPHPKQVNFIGSHDPLKAFLGGNRSGKTTAGIVDDLIQAVDADCLPEHLRELKKWEPPFKCRIVAPDFTENMEKVIFEKLREWAPKNQLAGGDFDKAYDKQRRVLRFANGSWFSFMTFEQDLDKFGGAALHRVHYDEEPPEKIRKECMMRLVDFNGDEVFTMTPLNGMTWMFDEVFEKRLDPGVTVIQVDMDENPYLNSEAKVRLLAGLTEEERQARKEGRFVHFGGLALGSFDESKHLVAPLEPVQVRGLDVLIGIDPGIVRGGVVWVGFDRDDKAVVFDCLYPQNQTVEQTCLQIHERNAFWGLDDPQYVVDPSAVNRDFRTGEALINEYQRFDIFPTLGQNRQEPGVNQMRRRLEHDMLFVSRDCRSWLWERQRWRLKQTDDGSFALEPGNDHLMDPTRYCLMERVWGPELGTANRPSKRRDDESWPPPARRGALVPVTGMYS